MYTYDIELDNYLCIRINLFALGMAKGIIQNRFGLYTYLDSDLFERFPTGYPDYIVTFRRKNCSYAWFILGTIY